MTKKKLQNIHKIVYILLILGLALLVLLIFKPKELIIGHYDFEELSPAVSRYPNFYALMIESNAFLDLESASLSASANLASKLHFENFILMHREAIQFNPAAFRLWATAFNIRGQNVQMATAPDRSGSKKGYFVMVFMFNEESEASHYALQNSPFVGDEKVFNVEAIQRKYKQAWSSTLTAPPSLRAEARLRLAYDASINESVNVVTFQNNDSKRWPFLLAIDTARQEALANGFSHFIILEANISGAEEMTAMQVRTRYLNKNEIPEDLYELGYRSFMIWQTQSDVVS